MHLTLTRDQWRALWKPLSANEAEFIHELNWIYSTLKSCEDDPVRVDLRTAERALRLATLAADEDLQREIERQALIQELWEE